MCWKESASRSQKKILKGGWQIEILEQILEQILGQILERTLRLLLVRTMS
jgi:hypothetical protein